MLHLRLWLATCFDLDPEDGIDAMIHGKQNDTFNCGLTSANTIAHQIFGEPLWTPQTAVSHRVQWFLHLSQPALKSLTSQAVNSDSESTLSHTTHPQVLVQFQKVNDVSSPKGEIDILVSLALAQRDHNFSTTDLANFANSDDDLRAADSPTRESRSRYHLSILELLNPATHLNDTEVVDSEVDYTHTGQMGDDEDMEIEDDNLNLNPDQTKDDPPNSTHVNMSSDSDADGSEDESAGERPDSARPTKRFKGNGKSKSATISMAKRTAFRKGKFIIEKPSLDVWKKAILADDIYATFDPTNLCRVRHSGCGKFFKVKEPLDLTRWRSHLKNCTEKPPLKKTKSAGTPSVFTMPGWAPKSTPKRDLDVSRSPVIPKPVNLLPQSSLPDTVITATRPCPGITELDCSDIARYLMRSSANGGGGQSIHKVTKKLFRKVFSSLQSTSKDEVLAAQLHTHIWRNDHQHLRIYSTACKKVVASRTPQRPLPCDACVSVTRSKAFKNAIRKKTPQPKNQIYTNKKYQNPVVGEIYSRHIGLKEIVESQVRSLLDIIYFLLV